ncbi:peptidase M15 [Phenylobacterium soli]|uniref:Peptidase M15 n=1 Tax=Phenylobacterium soli TaxID=2170551 RepID=A0A328AQ23_9CAUL|nr:peptidase M15 [Phenylobacterium soli]
MLKHARRLFVSLGLAAATLMAATPPAAQAQIPYFRNLLAATSGRYAAIVVDAKTGEVLYDRHADAPRYPASITKVMTLYLTFEALSTGKLHLDDRVVFSPHASAQAPTKLGVRPGDSVSVSEAIQAMTTLSANDAAVAMAEKIGGTESRFTALMNLRAQELGMQNTHFANANGLPDSRNLSTARDIAILSRAAMRDYPQYYHYFSQRSFTFRGRYVQNHNHMLEGVQGVDGLKTGFTNASGFNIAISGVRDGRRLIVVVLGGPTRVQRDQNAEDLLLTGFDVMRRRAMGEKLTIAQNLFEPEPTGPVVRPPVEQGDGDQDALKIELTSAPPPRAKVRGQPAKPAAKAERWGVQVGEFRSRADAKEQIALVQRKFGRHFDSADGAAEKAGRRYRAVFTGFSQGEAKDACRALKAKRLACAVVEPS